MLSIFVHYVGVNDSVSYVDRIRRHHLHHSGDCYVVYARESKVAVSEWVCI